MKHTLIGIITLLLAACSEPERETVISVSEFLADQTLRGEQIKKCRDNPGSLGQTSNCRNAEEAEGRARFDRMNKALGG